MRGPQLSEPEPRDVSRRGQWSGYCRLLIAFCLLSIGTPTSSTPKAIRTRSQQTLHRPILGLVATATATASALFPSPARAASLAPPRLGVDHTGMLSPCPDDALSRCVSSQDDRPACFIAPWEFDGDWLNARTKLVGYVLSLPGARLVAGEIGEGAVGAEGGQGGENGEGGGKGGSRGGERTGEGGKVVTKGSEPTRYLRFEVTGTEPDLTTAQSPFTDDLEFYFTPNDDIIQYRSVRRVGADFLGRHNRARVEQIRRALRLENIAVLRNRQPAFLFMESPLDQFGPPSSMFDGRFDDKEIESKSEAPIPPGAPVGSGGSTTRGAGTGPSQVPVAQVVHGVHSDVAYWVQASRTFSA